MIVLVVFLCLVSGEPNLKNDEGSSWLGTPFNPFTYGPFLSEKSNVGADFLEQKGVQSLYDRRTSVFQTFQEVSTVEDYYEASQLDVDASGGYKIFSGSASFEEKQTFNHSDLTQHRLFVGVVKETTRFVVIDHHDKNLTASWQ
jgi:hypothetical protein